MVLVKQTSYHNTTLLLNFPVASHHHQNKIQTPDWMEFNAFYALTTLFFSLYT